MHFFDSKFRIENLISPDEYKVLQNIIYSKSNTIYEELT